MKRFTRDPCKCSLDAASSSTKFSVNQRIPVNIAADHATGSPSSASMFSFSVFSVSVESCNRSLRARLRVLRLRMVAVLRVESSAIESCDTDVEDVLVDELGCPVDNPGTTMGMKFSVFLCIFTRFE